MTVGEMVAVESVDRVAVESVPVVEVKSLGFAYHDGREVLHDVNLSICQGEKVALVGPNGAGKSTLMLHLNGIFGDNDGAGSVCVMGQALKKENLGQIRAQVGLVFQDPDDQLFSPTVFEDVAFGPTNMGLSLPEVKQAVTDALAAVGMSGYEQRSPHHLSLGEKKRIAIATVLAMNPEILVFDEPTSNLDPRGRGALTRLFRKLPATKIIATHDLELVRAICSRTVVLDRGRVVADDATEKILADTHLLERAGLSAGDLSAN